MILAARPGRSPVSSYQVSALTTWLESCRVLHLFCSGPALTWKGVVKTAPNPAWPSGECTPLGGGSCGFETPRIKERIKPGSPLPWASTLTMRLGRQHALLHSCFKLKEWTLLSPLQEKAQVGTFSTASLHPWWRSADVADLWLTSLSSAFPGWLTQGVCTASLLTLHGSRVSTLAGPHLRAGGRKLGFISSLKDLETGPQGLIFWKPRSSFLNAWGWQDCNAPGEPQRTWAFSRTLPT